METEVGCPKPIVAELVCGRMSAVLVVLWVVVGAWGGTLPDHITQEIYRGKALAAMEGRGDTIARILATDPMFSHLELHQADLAELDTCGDRLTLFLPTTLPLVTPPLLLLPIALTTEHISPGPTSLATVAGEEVVVVWDTDAGAFSLQRGGMEAAISLPDTLACNGVIHAMDAFLPLQAGAMGAPLPHQAEASTSTAPPAAHPTVSLASKPTGLKETPVVSSTAATSATTTAATPTAATTTAATTTEASTILAATTTTAAVVTSTATAVTLSASTATTSATAADASAAASAAATNVEKDAESPSPPCSSALSSWPPVSTFLSSLTSTHALSDLDQGQPFTLFAPVNAAFLSLPAERGARFQESAELAKVLLARHTVPGTALPAAAIPAGRSSLTTAAGTSLGLTMDTFVRVESDHAAGHLVMFDLLCGRGVVHAVDTLL